jgi:hypothetical protein
MEPIFTFLDMYNFSLGSSFFMSLSASFIWYFSPGIVWFSVVGSKRNDSIQTFLQGLTPRNSTDYSLWKVTKKIKQITKSSPPLRTPQGTWAENNAEKLMPSPNT